MARGRQAEPPLWGGRGATVRVLLAGARYARYSLTRGGEVAPVRGVGACAGEAGCGV